MVFICCRPIGSRICYVQPKCDDDRIRIADDFIKTSGYLIDPVSSDKCANSILCNWSDEEIKLHCSIDWRFIFIRDDQKCDGWSCSTISIKCFLYEMYCCDVKSKKKESIIIMQTKNWYKQFFSFTTIQIIIWKDYFSSICMSMFSFVNKKKKAEISVSSLFNIEQKMIFK
jgi:hypothetical protein